MSRYSLILACTLGFGCSTILGIEDTDEQSPNGQIDAGASLVDAQPGTVDASPDPVGPATVFASASVSDGETTSKSNASFQFASNPAGAAETFECLFDRTSADDPFVDCTTGFDVSLLAGGVHTLEVRAVDAGGLAGRILTRTWTVEAVTRSILDVQSGSVEENTLVTLTARRVTLFSNNAPGGQVVFVQEAGATPGNPGSIANRGIMTRPADVEAVMAAGLEVTVTGTYLEVNNNSVIQRATYVRGPQRAAFASFFSNDTSEIAVENLEGTLVRVGGNIPNFNCSSGCSMSPAVCIHGCQGCSSLLSHVNLNQVQTFEFGTYTGMLVGTGENRYEFWFFASEENGDDICL